MVRSRSVKGPGSARTEGARRATGVRADAAAGGAGALAPGQRWSASRKRDVVLRLLRGESLDAVSREVGVELYRLEAWKERALAGLELGLKDQAGEPAVAALDTAKRHIGELSMEVELLRERTRAAERRLPLPMRRSRPLAQQQAHGLEPGRVAGEGGRDRCLDGRGGIGFQQPQHPDPLLIRLARLLPESGSDLLPHRRQRPVLQGRRLGDGAVLAFQHRQHVERIEHRRPGAKRGVVA